MDIARSTIVITGASRGIGAAIALRLARAGARLALCGRDTSALRSVVDVCQQAGSRVLAIEGDVTDPSFGASVCACVRSKFGGVDALVNNAGILDYAAADLADMHIWDRVIDVNLRAWIHLTRALLPDMLTHSESAVINICSIAGRETYATGGVYTATKHAIHAWAQCMFHDLAQRGLKVSTIYPGYVDTDMADVADGDRAAMIRPDDVARAVEFALSFPTSSCPTEIVLRRQWAM